MRKTIVTCDQCRSEIRHWITKYSSHPMPGESFASYDGERFDWEFCSTGCMITWLIARSRERHKF